MYIRQRRRRISTAQVQVAIGKKALYESADAEAMLALLTHKVVRAAQREGLEEARLMLTDWLVILAARYAEVYGRGAVAAKPLAGARRVDASFSECVPLQALPRLVYGLLRTALLQPLNVHPDQRTYLGSLAGVLEPQSLARVVYPLLCSWVSPDALAFPAHSLSRAALVTSGCSLFLLDAYLLVIVYYAAAPGGAAAAAEHAFPPPHKVREDFRAPRFSFFVFSILHQCFMRTNDWGTCRDLPDAFSPSTCAPLQCALRAQLNSLRETRAFTPRVLFIRGGLDDASEFDSQLIEARHLRLRAPLCPLCVRSVLSCTLARAPPRLSHRSTRAALPRSQRSSGASGSSQEPDVEGFGFVSFLDIVAMQATELLRA